MLKTRIITALVLLAILLPIMYLGNFLAFSAVVVAFFAAAIWECQRLFKKPGPILMSVIWTVFLGIYSFIWIAFLHHCYLLCALHSGY